MIKRIYKYIPIINRGIIIISVFISFIYFFLYLKERNYSLVLACSFVLLFPFVYKYLSKKYDLKVHIKFFMCLFLFLSLVLGIIVRVFDFNFIFDKFVHFISGVFISVYIIDLLNQKHKKYSTKQVVILILMINFSIALYWEILEYLGDNLLGLNSQKGGLDTMLDVVMAMTGTILFLFFYFKPKKYI